MKNINILKLILLTIIMFFPTQAITADNILPIARPSVDLETKNITAQKKRILPQPKPISKKIDISDNDITENVTNEEIAGSEVFIYPKNKPIIVQKKVDKAVKKSSI